MLDSDKLIFDAIRPYGGGRWGIVSVQRAFELMYGSVGLHEINCPCYEGADTAPCNCRVKFVITPPPGIDRPVWANQNPFSFGDSEATAYCLTQEVDKTGDTYWFSHGTADGLMSQLDMERRDLLTLHLHPQAGIVRYSYGDKLGKFVEHFAMRVDTIFQLYKVALAFKQQETRTEILDCVEPRAGQIIVWLPPEDDLNLDIVMDWATFFDGQDLPLRDDQQAAEVIAAREAGVPVEDDVFVQEGHEEAVA